MPKTTLRRDQIALTDGFVGSHIATTATILTFNTVVNVPLSGNLVVPETGNYVLSYAPFISQGPVNMAEQVNLYFIVRLNGVDVVAVEFYATRTSFLALPVTLSFFATAGQTLSLNILSGGFARQIEAGFLSRNIVVIQRIL